MPKRDSVDTCAADIVARFPEIDERVEGAVSRMSAVGKHVSRAFEDTLAAHGLSHVEYRLLVRLAARGEGARMSAGELCRALLLSSGAMTGRLDKLEQAGLIRRVRDPHDRRGVLVEMTRAGSKRIGGAVIEQAARESEVLSGLSPRQLDQLNNLLRRVLSSLESSAHSPARTRT